MTLTRSFLLVPALAPFLLAACGGSDGRAASSTGAGGGHAATATGATTSAGSGGGSAGSGGGAGGTCVDTGQHAVARSEMMGALDPEHGRLVFFGGDDGVSMQCMPAPHPIGQLWTYDLRCRSFTQVTAAGGPSARARGMAAIDAPGQRMLVFGGRFKKNPGDPYTLFDDVWALDLGALTWTELVAKGPKPSARSNPAGGVIGGQLVVFGGNTSTDGLAFSPESDTWALDLATSTWRQLPGSGPSARLFHAAAVDDAGGRLFVYGGGDANAFQGPFLRDLWELDVKAGAWKELDPGTGGSDPLGRIWSTLAYDAPSSRLLLFGGHDDGALGNDNDTWGFDLVSKAWSPITPHEKVAHPAAGFCQFPADFTAVDLTVPERRSAQLAGFDAAARAWTVYGGKTDCGLIDDVWTLDAERDVWTEEVKASIGESCTRGKHPQQCTGLCM